ncbi:MAG: IS200/IS605 family transposase [Planctomycetaceae bacterium]|nr:IS200/IS605 family transposase [Planctomycetaceae bacterium]
MANTFTSLHYHIVFSTKERREFIHSEIEQRVWEYLGGIAKQNGMKPLQVGGIEDHVHIVAGIPPTLAVSRAIQQIKGGSSRWIHETFSSLSKFTWQDGYGAFSVSRSLLPTVINYVATQREHHRKRNFQEEFREMLERHEIEYDERYVWG